MLNRPTAACAAGTGTFQGGPTCPFPIWNTSSSRPRISRRPRTGTSRCSASASARRRISSFRSIGSTSATATCCTSPPAARTSARTARNMSASSRMPATGTGVIDHVGFRTTGLHEMIEHLTKHKINFTERQVERPGALPAFPVRSERRQDRAQLRQRRGQGPHAAAQGDRIEPGDELDRNPRAVIPDASQHGSRLARSKRGCPAQGRA